VAFVTIVDRAEGICKEREYLFVYENVLDATRILVGPELLFLMSSHIGRIKENVMECRATWFFKL
jgi:hypothetical protein